MEQYISLIQKDSYQQTGNTVTKNNDESKKETKLTL